jgi:hypothetical protein
MRHFFLLCAILPGSRGMVAATAVRRLIALAGGALRAAPGFSGAACGTIDLPTIATGADEHLSAAARAEKKARGCMSLFGFVTETWTKRATSGILPRHSCSARCGARR